MFIKRILNLSVVSVLLVGISGIPVASASNNSYSDEELQAVASASNKSVSEVGTLLMQAQDEYENAKKNWKENISLQKEVLQKKIKEKVENKEAIDEKSAAEALLPKLKEGKYKLEGTNLTELSTTSLSSLGSVGDILVTLDNSSSSSYYGGHAAIVSNNSSDWTLESFMRGFSPQSPNEDGVYWHINDWKTRYDTVAGYWVIGAEYADYNGAAQYAEDQLYEGYSIDFWNKWRTDLWYCSQLVWRAWYENSYFDIDSDGGGAVWPSNLTNDNDLTAFYSSGI